MMQLLDCTRRMAGGGDAAKMLTLKRPRKMVLNE